MLLDRRVDIVEVVLFGGDIVLMMGSNIEGLMFMFFSINRGRSLFVVDFKREV